MGRPKGSKSKMAERGVMGTAPNVNTTDKGEANMADETTVETTETTETLGVREFPLEYKDTSGNVTTNVVKIYEFSGKTKGKGTRAIKYWNFNDKEPNTYPKNLAQLKAATAFVNTDAKNPEGKEFDNEKILEFMIDGFNLWSYNKQADEIGEYLNPEWPDDIQQSFRIAVRQTAKMTGMSIEDTANFLKGKVEESYQKIKASQQTPVTA